jgi:hypothetical protein
MAFIGSIMKFVSAVGSICLAVYFGMALEPKKEFADRVIWIIGVFAATCSPVGLFLYVKYWEEKPEFSSACGKQALVGLVLFAVYALANKLFPPVFEPWTR